MKKIFATAACLLSLMSYKTWAQDQTPNYVIEEKVKPGVEKYGNTLNLGAGIGYYGNIGILTPAVMLNYEFDIFRDFTLAPFVGASTFQESYYWGNPNLPNSDPSYRYYNYRETVIPVGIKGTYYFDEWLHVNPKWDLYLATSIGFAFKTVVWENGYNGNTGAYQAVNPLYVAMHIGGEYHLSRKAGLFLDLSTGISTFGLAIHF
ncbi:MAG TPA: hypothetical protein VNX01_15795 [Bacteroidia bacterium]|jgi:hypothetical protein|nr:hypothetical protein [Bacteroidia bacterium]